MGTGLCDFARNRRTTCNRRIDWLISSVGSGDRIAQGHCIQPIHLFAFNRFANSARPMDGTANGLLRVTYQSKSESADSCEPGRHYAIRRARNRVWMGPNIARSRRALRRHSGSFEIRIPVRRRDAVVNHKRTDRESTSGRPNGNRRQLVWAADSVLSADGARSNSCFQLCSEGADCKHDEGPGFGSRRSPIHVSRQQRYPQCAFRFQLVILFDWSPGGLGF
jgi:hypothetical protein